MSEKPQNRRKWQKPCVRMLEIPDLTQTGQHFDEDEDALQVGGGRAGYHPSGV